MFDKVLIISPHTDDGELGCGGTIAKLIEEDKELFYTALSSCEKSVAKGLPKDILKKEVNKALDVLKIPKNNRFIFNFENRIFPLLHYEIYEALEELEQKIQPDLVLIPSINDTHQDHSTTAQEAIRAFRRGKGSIVSYETPWNNLSFTTSLFVKLEDRHMKMKLRALDCYTTQAKKRYFTSKYIMSIAEARAAQIDSKYAEAFNVVKILL